MIGRGRPIYMSNIHMKVPLTVRQHTCKLIFEKNTPFTYWCNIFSFKKLLLFFYFPDSAVVCLENHLKFCVSKFFHFCCLYVVLTITI
jgi:hypothetical protein